MMGTFWQRLTANLIQQAPADPVTKAILATFVELILEEQNSLGHKLDRLIGSYYKKGYEYLNDAKDLGDQKKGEWIKRALDEFMTASNVESDLMSAKSKFFVGVCYDLLQEGGLALTWYRKAYWSGYAMIPNWIPNKSETIFESVGIKGDKKRKLQQELNNLLFFLDSLISLLNSRDSLSYGLRVDEQLRLLKNLSIADQLRYSSSIRNLERQVDQILLQEKNNRFVESQAIRQRQISQFLTYFKSFSNAVVRALRKFLTYL